jgi:CheY-like chemotaxis protein
VPVSYDVWITLASIVPAVLGSGIALNLMRRVSVGTLRLQVGALLLAAGIGTMHDYLVKPVSIEALADVLDRLATAGTHALASR